MTLRELYEAATVNGNRWGIIDTKDCINFERRKNTKGYGLIYYYNKTTKKTFYKMAHRVAYEKHFGAISPEKIICHKCNNPACINPDHLYQGTYADNTRDAMASGTHKPAPLKGIYVSHCRNGHPYDEKNTYIYSGDKRDGGKRDCRACHSKRQTERDKRKRAALLRLKEKEAKI